MKLRGIFSWDGRERRSDRYGTICLIDHDYRKTVKREVTGNKAELLDLAGNFVTIVVTVLETRDSGHIGDMFRNIQPIRPEVGEVINLGTGELFISLQWENHPLPCFGLLPDDGRKTDWFDPHKLYRLHDQTVELDITIAQTEFVIEDVRSAPIS